jgi:alkanesulfonate monooxygenase SsuD/methylene tetrahydromethanopterin reductase-like flavin-dependent oxidoreductase (luciferase family)
MRVGVVFPQTEIGSDPSVIKDYAQTAEGLGYTHILAYDHVIGANLASRPGWQPPYSHLDGFHEPLVLFGYLAALTKTIELATGIIILPQRQTVLVAKQAAELDVRDRHRVESGGIRSTGGGFQNPRTALRGAGRIVTPALDPIIGHL